MQCCIVNQLRGFLIDSSTLIDCDDDNPGQGETTTRLTDLQGAEVDRGEDEDEDVFVLLLLFCY